MIVLLQRVLEATVHAAGAQQARIGAGLLGFVAFERGDTSVQLRPMLERLVRYRVFPDSTGRMGCSLKDKGGELLLVPQFTLAADTRQGLRPDFGPALGPAEGRALWEQCRLEASHLFPGTQAGVFGADMQVALINDGPATFWLQSGARSTD